MALFSGRLFRRLRALSLSPTPQVADAALPPLTAVRRKTRAECSPRRQAVLTLIDSFLALSLYGLLSVSLSLWILLYLKPSNLFTVGLLLLYVSNLTAASFNSPVWRLHDKADTGF